MCVVLTERLSFVDEEVARTLGALLVALLAVVVAVLAGATPATPMRPDVTPPAAAQACKHLPPRGCPVTLHLELEEVHEIIAAHLVATHGLQPKGLGAFVNDTYPVDHVRFRVEVEPVLEAGVDMAAPEALP